MSGDFASFRVVAYQTIRPKETYASENGKQSEVTQNKVGFFKL